MGMYTGTVKMAIMVHLSDAQHCLRNPEEANEKINFAKFLLLDYANDLFKIIDMREEYAKFKKQMNIEDDEDMELSDEDDVFGLS
jgi:hypothetical protein